MAWCLGGWLAAKLGGWVAEWVGFAGCGAGRGRIGDGPTSDGKRATGLLIRNVST